MSRLIVFCLSLLLILLSCNQKKSNTVPVIGFLDVTEDATLAKARQGFFDALNQNGFSEEKKTLQVYHTNAQGDIGMLNQACDYLVSKKVDLIAANSTLSTITAVQRVQQIPVCMMVAPRPDLAGLTDASGKAPANLFGVYETLQYIDSSVALIKHFIPAVKTIGLIYNSSEPQSRDALSRLQQAASAFQLQVMALPVNNSSESQLVTQSLIAKKPDVFFALPDNVIFSSFETISKSCNDAGIPIFTSEAGLVMRGAVTSFGADFYQWGFQAGLCAAQFLKSNEHAMPPLEEVKHRESVFNRQAGLKFNLIPPSNFTIVN